MNRLLLRTKARLRDAAKPWLKLAVGALTVALLRTTRFFDPDKTANFFGRATRFIGRRLREDRIGRENLTAAFPEKTPEEIETILAGVWDNLGRIGAEFAHLDHIWDYDVDHPDKPSRVEFGARTKQIFDALRDDGKPAIIFASHLGNWEIPALGAVAHGLDCAILFRRPNIESADRAIERIRAVKMGTLVPAGREAPLKLAEALQRGQHVAMLVDQYMGNGVEVTFFGRKTKANPTLARLLRQVECPVHGVRIIRLPNHRFRAELSEEVKPVRDASGQIDIQGTMQAVTDRDRRLGAGISGPVAVAAPEMAVASFRSRMSAATSGTVLTSPGFAVRSSGLTAAISRTASRGSRPSAQRPIPGQRQSAAACASIRT